MITPLSNELYILYLIITIPWMWRTSIGPRHEEELKFASLSHDNLHQFQIKGASSDFSGWKLHFGRRLITQDLTSKCQFNQWLYSICIEICQLQLLIYIRYCVKSLSWLWWSLTFLPISSKWNFIIDSGALY